MPDLDRRHALGLLGSAALLALPAAARAQDGPTRTARQAFVQAPGFRRFTVGDTVVTALADGTFELTPELLPTLDRTEFARLMSQAYLPIGDGAYHAAVNGYLVRRDGRTVLIDTGGSPHFQPTMGALGAQLAAAGVAAESVDAVLMTHLHPDHTGGLAGATGAMFPGAELVVHEKEIAFWTDPATRAALPEPMRPLVDALNATLSLYRGRVTRFSGDDDVAPGIAPVFLPGHTPGHTGYRVADGDEQLLVWGDIVHAAAIQFDDPRVFVAYDTDPGAAVATRSRILDAVATDRTRVAGMHLPFPGIGHVAKASRGGGYRFVPSEWQYRLPTG